MITGCSPAHRCGSASTRTITSRPASSRAARPNAGTSPGSSASKHTVCSPTDETSKVMGSSAASASSSAAAADHAEHGRPDREPRLRRAAPARLDGTGTGSPQHERLDRGIVRVGRLHDRSAARASPTRPPPSTSPAARSRAVRPGPALGEVRVEDRHELEPALAEVADVVRPRRRAPRPPRAAEARRPVPAGEPAPAPRAPPTPRRAPRRPCADPKSRAPAVPAPPRRLAHHAPNAIPRSSGARRRTPRTRRGDRTRDRPAAMPYPGSGENRNAAGRRAERAHEPRRPSLRPGRARPRPAASAAPRERPSVSPSAAASDDGQSADSTTRRPCDRPAGERHVADVVVGRAILAQGRMRLARHEIEPEVGHGREHRRTRPHDHVEASGLHVEPRAVARPLGPPRGATPRGRRTPPRSPARSPGTGAASGTITSARRPASQARRRQRRPRPRPRPRAPDGAPTPRGPEPRSRPGAARPLRYAVEHGRGRRAGIDRPPIRPSDPAPPPPPPAGGSLARARPRAAPRTARPPSGRARAPARRSTARRHELRHRQHRGPARRRSAPSTHPRTDRPWNGTCTSEPTPAPSSAGRSYVNGRSRLRSGRSTQTATGPGERFGGLADGAAEVVDAVGRLPGELLAPEVPVGGGLAIDAAARGRGRG